MDSVVESWSDYRASLLYAGDESRVISIAAWDSFIQAIQQLRARLLKQRIQTQQTPQIAIAQEIAILQKDITAKDTALARYLDMLVRWEPILTGMRDSNDKVTGIASPARAPAAAVEGSSVTTAVALERLLDTTGSFFSSFGDEDQMSASTSTQAPFESRPSTQLSVAVSADVIDVDSETDSQDSSATGLESNDGQAAAEESEDGADEEALSVVQDGMVDDKLTGGASAEATQPIPEPTHAEDLEEAATDDPDPADDEHGLGGDFDFLLDQPF
ncbi:uncharacterized protein BJ171DRAFT_241476 [Polychytrium aggregatum]|uniref:uncharacterized protein n=1 Tax=Polychytrium aggregatum TaxID=110093 RepID=UPI0022FDF696|nr:uncharacterized protein BJ171DRAFT_241476 [Polychytrium aggregatum]KAI9197049.1 hypothetical protein BJ171DRAFT_241476 [Polychytrium aggregatum]